jgi:sterol desaturase/sphingolipid hydroxylase (fatty acid hydroxylase superfamily)
LSELTFPVVTAVVSLVFLVVMFAPLERAFPARPTQRFFRRGFVTDLAFFAGQHLVFGALAASVLALMLGPLSGLAPLSGLQGAFLEAPIALQVAVVLLLGDFFAYWGHRLQHRVEFLWRFHAIHHTNEEVDWLAAHREHPLDGLYTQAMVNLPALILGFDLSAALGLIASRSLWAIFIHSNVRLPLGPLRYIVGSPTLHRWHHARDRDAGNYANLGPWLDVLFGTYYCPKAEPESLGLPEPMPDRYVALLLHPFRRRSLSDASSAEPTLS